jgi:hypothetical protein
VTFQVKKHKPCFFEKRSKKLLIGLAAAPAGGAWLDRQ